MNAPAPDASTSGHTPSDARIPSATPLALVRMFSELLMTGRVASDDKRQQYLQIIVRESERLTALIENVLDFARVEKGRVAYEFAPGDLGLVAGRAVEACRYRAETEGMMSEKKYKFRK